MPRTRSAPIRKPLGATSTSHSLWSDAAVILLCPGRIVPAHGAVAGRGPADRPGRSGIRWPARAADARRRPQAGVEDPRDPARLDQRAGPLALPAGVLQTR